MRRLLKQEVEEYVDELIKGNQSITVRTLEQTEANWSNPISSFGKLSNLVPIVNFARIQKLNQELEIVVSVKYTNETQSNIAAYSTDGFEIELPQEIANKIYDCNGVSAKESLTSETYIASCSAYASKSTGTDASKITGSPRLLLTNGIRANRIVIRFSSTAQIIVEPNGYTIIEGRIQLTLI